MGTITGWRGRKAEWQRPPGAGSGAEQVRVRDSVLLWIASTDIDLRFEHVVTRAQDARLPCRACSFLPPPLLTSANRVRAVCAVCGVERVLTIIRGGSD